MGLLAACLFAVAQEQPPLPKQSQAPPRSSSDDESGDQGASSSHDTRIDLSPPKDDIKNHPSSGIPDASEGDVREMHPWNPYKAAKDDEVGEYYFKKKNYHAALARYQDALIWKDNDAVANFRIAQCLEKMDQPDEAMNHYEAYLKILPGGPFSKDARKALVRLQAKEDKHETSQKTEPKQ